MTRLAVTCVMCDKPAVVKVFSFFPMCRKHIKELSKPRKETP